MNPCNQGIKTSFATLYYEYVWKNMMGMLY